MAQITSKFEGYRKFSVEGYDYIVTYFKAVIKGSGSPLDVTDQFTKFVEKYADDGYEFYRTDSVPYEIQPGCIAALFGSTTSFGYATIVTFRKKIEE